LLQAAEQTGDVPTVLRRYVLNETTLDGLRRKLTTALTYPLVLCGVGLLVIAFLLGYVVPRFSRIYEDFGSKLSWSAKAMVAWSQFIDAHGWLTLLGLLGLVAAMTASVILPALRARVARQLWRLPGFGAQMRTYQLARFTHALGMLINSGIPVPRSIELVRQLLAHDGLRDGIAVAAGLIQEGRSVSAAFAAGELASEVGIRLIMVGENAGSLGAALERLAHMYDAQLADWVERFSRLFEPLLMLFIGISIGVIVILMYLPIFELASALQ
jgi:general secretion pathway protein F